MAGGQVGAPLVLTTLGSKFLRRGSDRRNVVSIPCAAAKDVYTWQRSIRGQQPPHVMVVALMMSTYANRDGSSVRPGLKRLGEATGLSRTSLWRSINALTESGWLVCTEEAGKRTGGTGKANVYQLTIPTVFHERNQPCSVDEPPPSRTQYHSTPLERVQAPLGRASEDPWNTELVDSGVHQSEPPNEEDYEPEPEEWIEDKADGLSGTELSTAIGMLHKGRNRYEIVGKIKKDRDAA